MLLRLQDGDTSLLLASKAGWRVVPALLAERAALEATNKVGGGMNACMLHCDHVHPSFAPATAYYVPTPHADRACDQRGCSRSSGASQTRHHSLDVWLWAAVAHGPGSELSCINQTGPVKFTVPHVGRLQAGACRLKCRWHDQPASRGSPCKPFDKAVGLHCVAERRAIICLSCFLISRRAPVLAAG